MICKRVSAKRGAGGFCSVGMGISLLKAGDALCRNLGTPGPQRSARDWGREERAGRKGWHQGQLCTCGESRGKGAGAQRGGANLALAPSRLQGAEQPREVPPGGPAGEPPVFNPEREGTRRACQLFRCHLILVQQSTVNNNLNALVVSHCSFFVNVTRFINKSKPADPRFSET